MHYDKIKKGAVQVGMDVVSPLLNSYHVLYVPTRVSVQLSVARAFFVGICFCVWLDFSHLVLFPTLSYKAPWARKQCTITRRHYHVSISFHVSSTEGWLRGIDDDERPATLIDHETSAA